LTFNK